VLARYHAEGGEVLLLPSHADHLYRLESGLVRLYRLDGDGASATLRYVKPGGYFGEEALTGARRHYFAEAVPPSVVEYIDPAGLDGDDLLQLAASLADALGRVSQALHRQAAKLLRARVAAELLELSHSDLSQRGGDGTSTIRLTHGELANAVGAARETTTKVVGELKRLGAIHTGYGKITVRDERLLRKVADE